MKLVVVVAVVMAMALPTGIWAKAGGTGGQRAPTLPLALDFHESAGGAQRTSVLMDRPHMGQVPSTSTLNVTFYSAYWGRSNWCQNLAVCPSGWWVDVAGMNATAAFNDTITLPVSDPTGGTGSFTIDYSYGCSNGCAFPPGSANASVSKAYPMVSVSFGGPVVSFAFLGTNGSAVYPSTVGISVVLNGISYSRTGCPSLPSNWSGVTKCGVVFVGPDVGNSPGPYPYSVAPIPGYQINMTNTQGNAGCKDSGGIWQFDGASWNSSGFYFLNSPFGGQYDGVCFAQPRSSSTYGVLFQETGLPRGTNWSVTLGGSTIEWNLTQILFSRANGTYAFSVGKVPGYKPHPGTGTVNVSGQPVAIQISFVPQAYEVMINESGLPARIWWNVTATSTYGNETTAGTHPTGSVVFYLSNGTWNLTAMGTAGYTPVTSAFLVTVHGKAQEFTLPFVLLSESYAVTFAEANLTHGDAWVVTLGGVASQSRASTIAFREANGTDGFAVKASHWCALPSSGNVTISGGSEQVAVTFAFCYQVSFVRPQGVPNGGYWSVTLTRSGWVFATISRDDGSVTNGSVATTTMFQEPNGTYHYYVHAAGDSSYNGTGTVTVVGGNASVTPPALRSAGQGGFLGLPGSDGYLLIGVVAIVVIGAAAVLLLRGRGERKAPGSPTKERPESTNAERTDGSVDPGPPGVR